MRGWWIALLVAGCGRFGFDQLAAPDGGSGHAIVDVQPLWAMPAGGPIDVTLDGDAAGASVTIDGAACEPATITGATIHCVAPSHPPADVAIEVSDPLGTSRYSRSFAYLTAGSYQLGEPATDNTSGIALDLDGNVYITGGTNGDLGGNTNQGDYDALLVKYTPSGAVEWVRTLGTPLYDYSRDVAVDPSGNITIVGYTAGSLGGANAGSNDIFVARYSPAGDLVWVTQTGTAGDDQSWDLGVDDAGNTVISGWTNGAFPGKANAGGLDYLIARYRPDGQLAWLDQVGTTVDDHGHSIAVRGDGVAFLVGYTLGSIEMGVTAANLDMFTARYEPDGTRSWIRQRGGTADEAAQDAAIAPDGSVWAAGYTTGSIDGQGFGGAQDVFAMHFAADGTWLLTRQYGGTGTENTFGVCVTANGDVHVAGNTTIGWDGETYSGGPSDIFVVEQSEAGVHRWTRIVGSTGTDQASSCAIDRSRTGFVFVSAITDASLDGVPNRGATDLAVVKLDPSGAPR